MSRCIRSEEKLRDQVVDVLEKIRVLVLEERIIDIGGLLIELLGVWLGIKIIWIWSREYYRIMLLEYWRGYQLRKEWFRMILKGIYRDSS